MVRLNDAKYTRLSNAEKRKLMDKYLKKADEKIEDQTFFNELITKYKAKLLAEKTRN